MSGRPPQTQQAQQMQAARPPLGKRAMAGETTWERDWRSDVMRQLQDSANAHQQTAVIQERMMGMLNEHDRRIAALEQQPTQQRQARVMDANLTLYIVITCVAVASLVMSLGNLIAQHWH